jgi:uncharacterized membrane protein YciS (DUF1049 family)
MDWAAIAAALVNAGGWAVVVVMGIAIGIGIVRQWWVPGGVYLREVARADKATAQAELNTQSIRDLTRIVTDALIHRRQ